MESQRVLQTAVGGWGCCEEQAQLSDTETGTFDCLRRLSCSTHPKGSKKTTFWKCFLFNKFIIMIGFNTEAVNMSL